ncbi:hypothetical protein UlMin_038835 [Ulmus minor]
MKFSKTSTLLVLVYVDDIIVSESYQQEIEKIIQLLNTTFSLKDLGNLSYFLGIKATLVADGLLLGQKKCISDLLIKSKMDNVKPLSTPMINNLKLNTCDGDPIPNDTEYKIIVGALQYITITRPDIAFSVNKVCQFMQAPHDVH